MHHFFFDAYNGRKQIKCINQKYVATFQIYISLVCSVYRWTIVAISAVENMTGLDIVWACQKSLIHTR